MRARVNRRNKHAWGALIDAEELAVFSYLVRGQKPRRCDVLLLA